MQVTSLAEPRTSTASAVVSAFQVALKILVIFIGPVATHIASPAFARSLTTAKNTRTARTAPLTRFDASQDQLPARFGGADFEQLYRLLRRGEFETTDAFQSRVPDGVYAFRLSHTAVSYDADRSLFTVSASTSEVTERLETASQAGIAFDASMVVFRDSTSEKKYKNNSAIMQSRQWGVVLDRPPFATLFTTTFSAAPDVAAGLKRNIAVIALVQVTRTTAVQLLSETGDNPELKDVTGFHSAAEPRADYYYYGLRAAIAGFWIYDFRSGTILSKVPLQPEAATKP